MKFLILGDIHGDWTAMNTTIARACREQPDITHIVQVGDLAYGWRGIKPFKASRSFFSDEEMEIYNNADKMWLDGNHENHDLLDQDQGAWLPEWTYKPRGSVIDIQRDDGEVIRAMFFGGGYSIDWESRTLGVSLWGQERIQYGQILRAMEAEDGPIHAIFSHEHPKAFPYSDRRYDNDIVGFNDKRLLDELRKKYRPEFWFFGHHHYGEMDETEGTKWCCCPIIESLKYTTWDGFRMENHDRQIRSR